MSVRDYRERPVYLNAHPLAAHRRRLEAERRRQFEDRCIGFCWGVLAAMVMLIGTTLVGCARGGC
jgi:hypothetical protein